MPTRTDPRIDAYLAAAAPFAQPILRHLRKLVRASCPAAVETIKWGHPSFTLGGKILCCLAAFKAHLAFGFWGPAMHQLLKEERGSIEGAMGVMGRITSRADLPGDAAIARYVKTAAQFLAAGKSTVRRAKVAKQPLPVPADLAAALKKNRVASTTFEGFPPGGRREYIEWITEAQRPETRATRLATTMGWLGEGKRRNWQHENC